jgi:hypothetical protein
MDVSRGSDAGNLAGEIELPVKRIVCIDAYARMGRFDCVMMGDDWKAGHNRKVEK